MISANFSPNDYLTVRYDLSENYHAIADEGDGKSARLDFTNGKTEATLSIPITNDNMTENDSAVRVTLVADNANPITYTVIKSPGNSTELVVYDDDTPPRVQITRDNGEVIEGSGPARFILTATGITSTTTLMIKGTPSESGSNYLTSGTSGTQAIFPIEFSDPDGDSIYNGELTLPLVNDTIGEATANISVRLHADLQNYRLLSNHVGMIKVFDDDAPELSIRSLVRILTEGVHDRVNFKITAKTSPNKIINVQYDLFDLNTSGQSFINNAGTGKSIPLDFRFGATEATISIMIDDDETVEPIGRISVELKPDSALSLTYTVAPPYLNRASSTIYDDDGLPKLSLVSDNSSVSESRGFATFNFSLTNPIVEAAQTLRVFMTLTDEEGDFLNDSITDITNEYNVQFYDLDGDDIYQALFKVDLDNDSIAEPTGKIKLTVHPDTEGFPFYKIVSTNESIITVYDDDAPELRVSAVNPTITEAENASADFKITAQYSPYDNITVRYDLAESNNFISAEGTSKTEVLDFTNGITERMISFPIANNTLIEANGTITATLVADTSNPITYSVAASPNNSAVVNIIDDESLPVISIAADSGDAAESDGTAQFKLSATGFTTTTSLMINATPAEDGSDFLTDTVANTAADFAVEFSDPDGDGTIVVTYL